MGAGGPDHKRFWMINAIGALLVSVIFLVDSKKYRPYANACQEIQLKIWANLKSWQIGGAEVVPGTARTRLS